MIVTMLTYISYQTRSDAPFAMGIADNQNHLSIGKKKKKTTEKQSISNVAEHGETH